MRGMALFWWFWLLVVSGGVVAAGLVMLLAPGLTRLLFSLLLFASPVTIDRFGQQAVGYATLTHGVLGAVLFGWGVMLLAIVAGPLRRQSREAWTTCAISVAAWFIADTGFSLATGFWQNAVLNGVLAILFGLPLVGIRGTCEGRPERFA